MTPRQPSTVRILVSDDLHPDGLAHLHAHGFEPLVSTGLSEDQLIEQLQGVHALLIRSATKVTARVLEAAKDLELVGRAGVGVDNVDLSCASARGVIVMNAPTGNTVTTGELAISLICSLARNIGQADRRVRGGTWSKKGLLGSELTGKTVGVIGLGRIGRVVADRAMGLSMRVVAHDPFLPPGASPVDGVELLPLEELLEQVDFVTLHVPLTDQTRNILSRERLASMKPGARVINAARGGLVDEAALVDLLESGHLAGAALDVLAEEPPAPDHPLLSRDDVLITPHLGASSHEAQRAVSVMVAEQLVSYFTEGVAHNAVNAPVVSAKKLRVLGPYGTLAGRMGSLLAQAAGDPIEQIECVSAGEVSSMDEGRYLELSLLGAVLGQSLDVGVNLVNAPLLASERGLRSLSGTQEDSLGYRSLIRARATTRSGRTLEISGTVFGGDPRIVAVDGARVDFSPRGHLIWTQHHDRPGVLGSIGSRLGQHGVNIRRVELAPPHGESGLAAAFLSLYDEPSPEAIQAVAELEVVEDVRHLKF